MLRKDKNFIFGIFGILFLLNILAWLAVYDLSRSHFLEVNFFDVGQGDAIFIETPERHQILIDGGPDSTILEKLAKEMPFWDRTIDLIILTHPDTDHLRGLIEVLKKYKVENILWTGVVKDTSGYKEWLNSIQNEKAIIKIAQAGQRIITSRTVLDILYPFENLAGQEVKNINDTSIVAKLAFGGISFLFTGDIYESVERKLAESGTNLDSNILKVAHQGSKTSNSEEFIKRVSPEIAVISVGKNNRYGHPHQAVLDILERYGITVFRTDTDGDIKIISDGRELRLKTKN